MSKEIENLKSRLMKNSKWNGDCLDSTYKAKTHRGYVNIKYNKSTRGAHRLSWMVHYGEIPDGMLVCHRCDRPTCINPDHLFLGTNQDNTNDMVKKGRNNFQGATKHEQKIVDEAIRLRKEGVTYKKISLKLNIPMHSIGSFFKRKSKKNECENLVGVPKYSNECRAKAFELKRSGVLCKDIQKILNIPKRTLTRILKNEPLTNK